MTAVLATRDLGDCLGPLLWSDFLYTIAQSTPVRQLWIMLHAGMYRMEVGSEGLQSRNVALVVRWHTAVQ